MNPYPKSKTRLPKSYIDLCAFPQLLFPPTEVTNVLNFKIVIFP